jgi:hypothetical protein
MNKLAYFSTIREDYNFKKYLKQLDWLFQGMRYFHFDGLISGGKTNYDIEFLKETAEYFAIPHFPFCHEIYCRKPENERNCDNCNYIPKTAWQ